MYHITFSLDLGDIGYHKYSTWVSKVGVL